MNSYCRPPASLHKQWGNGFLGSGTLGSKGCFSSMLYSGCHCGRQAAPFSCAWQWRKIWGNLGICLQVILPSLEGQHSIAFRLLFPNKTILSTVQIFLSKLHGCALISLCLRISLAMEPRSRQCPRNCGPLTTTHCLNTFWTLFPHTGTVITETTTSQHLSKEITLGSFM